MIRGMTKKSELTSRQQEVLQVVADLCESLSRPPTVTELAKRIEISRQNTREHVWRLRDLGYLNFKAQDRQALTPVLTPKASALLEKPGFAVLGCIAAGQPLHAAEQLESYTDRLSDLLPLHEGDFLLKVDGNSMVGAGYLPGDYVVVHPTQEVLDGEVVVAFLPNEETATLKRYYQREGEALLVAENAAYAPLRLPLAEVTVQGVVVGHIGHRRRRKPLRDVVKGEGE